MYATRMEQRIRDIGTRKSAYHVANSIAQFCGLLDLVTAIYVLTVNHNGTGFASLCDASLQISCRFPGGTESN